MVLQILASCLLAQETPGRSEAKACLEQAVEAAGKIGADLFGVKAEDMLAML